MSSPEIPFIDFTIGYGKWAAKLARTDEERARIDRAHLLEGTEILFAALRVTEIPIQGNRVRIKNFEEMPDDVRKFIGAEKYVIAPDSLSEVGGFKSAYLMLVSQDYTSSDYDVSIEITKDDSNEDPKVKLSRSYPLNKHIGFTPLQVVRVANWLVDYYREQTGQQSQVASALDSK